MKRLNLIIIAIVIIAGAAGFYYYQKNIYSKEILKLEILGSEEADLLEEVEYIVKYKNNGNTRLEEPELIFEYPDYSVAAEGGSLRVTKNSEELGGAIYPGEEKTFLFRARLLGGEGAARIAKASLSYRPKNLKPRYESSTSFTTVIKGTPLAFEFDLPSKVGADKDFKFGLNYSSYVDYPISNLRAAIEYPSDFEFIESSPPSLEKTEWDIGVLNKADGGRIEVTGKLTGEVGGQKIFKARLGSWQEGEFVLLKEVYEVVEIIEPSLYISQQINGSPQYIASHGDSLHYEISFKNIGDDFLSNMSLICKLEGRAFDFSTIKAPQANVNLGDNSIIFDWKSISELQFLDAGEEGIVDFWIDLKDEWPIIGISDKNPVIKNKIFLSQIKEEFTNKVNSKLVIEQKGYFEDEIFGNSGPIPPEVGQSTTYTIIWNARNYYNDIENVKVKATLSSGVELTGEVFPEEENENLTFDSSSMEIVWDIGELKMSEGVDGTPSPNVSFQVSLTPTASHVGKTAELINKARITGQDQWTQREIEGSSDSIDTGSEGVVKYE